jgi:hypothetical protein
LLGPTAVGLNRKARGERFRELMIELVTKALQAKM